MTDDFSYFDREADCDESRTAMDRIVRREIIRAARLRQPITELARKRDKARRRSIWTQEDVDHADAFARVMLQKLNAPA